MDALQFFYPSDPLKKRQPDEIYAAEFAAMSEAGFSASVFSFEDFQEGSFRAFPPLEADRTVIYRGWMLSPAQYEKLVSAIINSGAIPLTDLDSYLSTHYLPNWYPKLVEWTPETKIYPQTANLPEELRNLNWPEYFIKDFVKSVKTSTGSRISTPEQAAALANEMNRLRGTIEGGFCVRRVEDFQTETERRYFVFDSVAYGIEDEIPGVVSECAAHIASRFFSVDVVQRRDGVLRIVEVGDGQVSDLVGWEPKRFAQIFKTLSV